MLNHRASWKTCRLPWNSGRASRPFCRGCRFCARHRVQSRAYVRGHSRRGARCLWGFSVRWLRPFLYRWPASAWRRVRLQLGFLRPSARRCWQPPQRQAFRPWFSASDLDAGRCLGRIPESDHCWGLCRRWAYCLRARSSCHRPHFHHRVRSDRQLPYRWAWEAAGPWDPGPVPGRSPLVF